MTLAGVCTLLKSCKPSLSRRKGVTPWIIHKHQQRCQQLRRSFPLETPTSPARPGGWEFMFQARRLPLVYLRNYATPPHPPKSTPKRFHVSKDGQNSRLQKALSAVASSLAAAPSFPRERRSMSGRAKNKRSATAA